MDLKKIDSFLERFKDIGRPDITIRKGVSLAIKNVLGAEVDLSKISFNKKTGVVSLRVNNTQKSAIFLRKKEIIGVVNKDLNKDLIKDLY